MKEPQYIYERRKQAYEKLQKKQSQSANRLSNLRLSTVILGFALAYFLYRNLGHSTGILTGLMTILLFGYLATKHRQVRTQLKYSEILADLNDKGLKRLNGEWVTFSDSGDEYKDEEHPYASDLDLFGQASFFQWTNSAQTPWGRETLRNDLRQPPDDYEEILKRQEAVVELAEVLAWRQRFEAEGVFVGDQFPANEPLFEWAEQTQEEYLQPVVRLGMRVLPVVTVLMVLLYGLKLSIPWQVPVFLVGVQAILLWVYGKERSGILTLVRKYEASLKTYAEMLKHLEERKFNADWLKSRQSILRDESNLPAFKQIEKLSKLVERISNRENAMFMIVNILILWDYQCMIELEQWKKKSGRLLKIWLQALAELEAISSLANIRYDHPEWAMPQILLESGPNPKPNPNPNPNPNFNFNSNGEATSGLSARKMGHPLITQHRVANDFVLKKQAGIILITGSNMSGKSTFLRTVGINLIMAYIGAPVCAEQMSCLRMKLWTCMRVSDNLEQSISSFYAEILRIKRIVQASKTDKPVFFLLDEIFKGTNSHDRHQGASALIQQLQKEGARGLVSTHDLELGELERQSNGRIRNYHFREYYENQEIRFDYTLRPGVSTTRNALYLIKLAGIEIEESI